jgi:hypothetical protein
MVLCGMEFKEYRAKKLGIWQVKLKNTSTTMIDFTKA